MGVSCCTHSLISPLSVSPVVGNGSHLSGEETGRDSRSPHHWKEIPSWDVTENQASGLNATCGCKGCPSEGRWSGEVGQLQQPGPLVLGAWLPVSCALAVGVQFTCVFQSGLLVVLGGVSPSSKVPVS